MGPSSAPSLQATNLLISRVAVFSLGIAPGWGDCGAAEHDVGQEQSGRQLHEASLLADDGSSSSSSSSSSSCSFNNSSNNHNDNDDGKDTSADNSNRHQQKSNQRQHQHEQHQHQHYINVELKRNEQQENQLLTAQYHCLNARALDFGGEC